MKNPVGSLITEDQIIDLDKNTHGSGGLIITVSLDIVALDMTKQTEEYQLSTQLTR